MQPDTRQAPVHRGEWRTLPPLQRVLGPHPLAGSGDAFSGLLTTWRDPSSLAPLGHDVVDLPGGLIGSLSSGTASAAGRPGAPDDDRPPVRHASTAGPEPVTIARWAAPAPSPDALPVVSRAHGAGAEPRGEPRGDERGDGSSDGPLDGPRNGLAPGVQGGAVLPAARIPAWDGSEQAQAVGPDPAGGTRPLSGDTAMSTSAAETVQFLAHESSFGQVTADPGTPSAGPGPGPAVQRTAARRLGLGPPIETGTLGDVLGGAAPWNTRGDAGPARTPNSSGEASGHPDRSGTTPTVARIEVHGAHDSVPGRSATQDPPEVPSDVRVRVEPSPVAPTLGLDRPRSSESSPVPPGESGRTAADPPPGRPDAVPVRGIGTPVQRTHTGTAGEPPAATRPEVAARAVPPEAIPTRPLLGARGIEPAQSVSVPLLDAAPDPLPAADGSPVPRTGGAGRLVALQRSAAGPVPPVLLRTAVRGAAWPPSQAPASPASAGPDTTPIVQAVHTPAVSTPSHESGRQADPGTAAPYDRAEAARQVVMRLAAAGVPVSREESPVADRPEFAQTPPQAAPSEGAEPAGRSPGDAKQDQELVGRLLEPLLRRLRAELWLERERRGDLSEPGGRRF
ncbi:hypothetical protein [Planotetraspora kaengkrachanensis]|uniref:Uncharacterized protein n=1 Tax=Planotetraspora kaengkrachanensis TaxID=575193 RepID=A0A8J3VAA9_9ACTN|nr:hypothetical protein [Planotetraspora kaengkrachanensis]GIG82679.1 hypothetical protein Pka01_58060 [Planotetraspora kaengkrachanensis]